MCASRNIFHSFVKTRNIERENSFDNINQRLKRGSKNGKGRENSNKAQHHGRIDSTDGVSDLLYKHFVL